MSEKLQKAKELREQGLTLEAIGKKLGISKVAVHSLLKQDRIELLINKLNELEKRVSELEEKKKSDKGIMDYSKSLGIFAGN